KRQQRIIKGDAKIGVDGALPCGTLQGCSHCAAISAMSRKSLLLACLLSASASALAQEGQRASGGELPSEEEMHQIASEVPFSGPKGHVLPPTADLSPWFPPAGDQFGQASCSG